MKNIVTISVLALLLTGPVIAQTSITSIEEAFETTNPDGFSVKNTTIISQLSVTEDTEVSVANFEVEADSSVFDTKDIIYGLPILFPFSEKGSFVIETEIYSTKENDIWTPKRLIIRNLEELSTYIGTAKTRSEWQPAALIYNTPEYNDFITALEKKEEQYFSELPKTLMGNALCDDKMWKVEIDWSINRTNFGDLNTNTVLETFENPIKSEFKGQAFYDPEGIFNYHNPLDYDNILSFSNRAWPRIVETTREKNAWIGASVYPDKSICSIILSGEPEDKTPEQGEDRVDLIERLNDLKIKNEQK
jgi:hypothetical protein